MCCQIVSRSDAAVVAVSIDEFAHLGSYCDKPDLLCFPSQPVKHFHFQLGLFESYSVIPRKICGDVADWRSRKRSCDEDNQSRECLAGNGIAGTIDVIVTVQH